MAGRGIAGGERVATEGGSELPRRGPRPLHLKAFFPGPPDSHFTSANSPYLNYRSQLRFLKKRPRREGPSR